MNQIKYVENTFSKTGTSLKDATLEAMLNHCLTLPPNGKKGNYGAIFIYNSNQLGVHADDETSTGIILLDIDYIDKETADKIYDNFELLIENWGSLLAIQYSSSYYINPNKNGLHIYVKSYRLDKDEYSKQGQICLGIFAQLTYKLLNIDLMEMSSEENPVLDFHNTSIYQRFVLFHSTYKYNEYAEPFDLGMIKFNELERLILKYNLTLDNVIKKTITPTMNNVCEGKGSRIKIDRYLKIGPYAGNDIRFRISIIADKLFGDNAKAFCDRFFFYENNKSIYTHYPAGNTINPLIYKWLVEKNYIIERKQNKIMNWLDEYTNDIIEAIRIIRQLEITAPTCSGKTFFINNFLAHKFNSIVIVPFNATNALYGNLFEVNASYTGKVPKNRPVVMVWDQAIKHWEEIKDRHMIIDEAHTLFLDRTYRDAAIKLMINIKECNSWATFITATPAGEKDVINMKQIHYYKDKNTIRLNIKATKNIEWSQYNYIKKCLDNNWYDKIVLLDDTSAKKIYEQLVINGYATDICYIRSSTKDSEDFIDLCTNELLRKKITICTCVAYNGLNFRNEGESILVVGSIQLGETTACQMIQQVGRIRNSNVSAIYFYDPERIVDDDIDARKQKAQEYNTMMINGVPDTFLSYDRRYLNEEYVNALKEIQNYQKEHANLQTIISELGSTGYISGKFEDELKDNEKVQMSLVMKRKESDEIKADILDDTFLEKEYEGGYKEEWARWIRYVTSNPFYMGITMNTFKEMINNGTKNTLIETSINKINEIIRYTRVDEREYDNVMKNIGLFANILSNIVEKKKFISTMKRIKNIREKYCGMIKLNNGTINFEDVITDVIAMEAEKQLKLKEGGKKGGKKGKRSKKIKDMETGKIYNSIKECAEDIGKSSSYICKYTNRFKDIS